MISPKEVALTNRGRRWNTAAGLAFGLSALLGLGTGCSDGDAGASPAGTSSSGGDDTGTSANDSGTVTSGNTETGVSTADPDGTAGTGGTGEGGFEPQAVERVLLIGFDPDEQTSLGAVAEQLEALLKTENPDAVVQGHNTAGTMLHQSYWSAEHQAGTLDLLALDSWDSVVIVGHRPQITNYPEFYYNGVSPIVQTVVGQDGTPVVYAHRGAVETELGYRVGRGTSSQVAPVGPMLDELSEVEAFASSAVEEKYAVAAAMGLYVFYTGKNPADLPSETLPSGGDLLDSIGDDVNELVYSEMSTTHYDGPYSGVVKLAPQQVPDSGAIGFFWAGTSTEVGWNQTFSALLESSGHTSISERVTHEAGRTLGDIGAAEAVAVMDASADTYYLALARNWEDTANDLLDSYDVQCMIYSKFEPGNGIPADAESISNNLLQPFMVVAKYPASGINRTYLPLFSAVARYYESHPDVAFSNDGTHMTGPFRNLLASMSFTAFSNEMASTEGLGEDATAAVQMGHEIVRQFAHLSDSGEYVADFEGNAP
ncbi:MAG: hypothetical protein K0V04_43250 [Deltaproteobacteria bacterium]|nr:hypothetical protein [Deltaproteobacteria bacterium]